MIDIVDRATRSRMMSGIRSRDTTPELRVRKFLHQAGMRFRLHDSSIPGRPDIVLKKFGVAIFVHGCFWHGHRGCRYFRLPTTRSEFWRQKIEGNCARDLRNKKLAKAAGWRVLIVWECDLRNKPDFVLAKAEAFIRAESRQKLTGRIRNNSAK